MIKSMISSEPQLSSESQLFLFLGRLEGKVDALLSNQTRQDKRQEEFDVRLTVLETFKARGTGVLRTMHVVWGGIAALALALLPYALENWR